VNFKGLKMITYNETEDGGVSRGSMYAPKNNRLYAIAHEEVAAGDAEIIPFDHVAAAIKEAECEARVWRDGELAKADIEINKLDDEGGNSSDYRAYRIALREWPQSDAFPELGRPQEP
jgi:hypothetical protein